MIIDTHCHFDMMSRPEAFISEKERNGDIVIGMTNLPSHFKIGQPHLNSFRHVRLALGLHPLLAAKNRNEVSMFHKFVDHTSYIGEIGLDFSREGVDTKDEQIKVLREILVTLKGKRKIISVHSRKAEKELLELLCEYDIENVIFHWYSGPVDLIPSIVSKGYYFSVNEAMCTSKNGLLIIKNIPKERILTESDAPYNERCNIRNVLESLSLSEQDICSNFMNLLKAIR